MLPSTHCSRARRTTPQRPEVKLFCQRYRIYTMRLIPMPGPIPFGFANSGCHRRTYSPNSCKHPGEQVASRRSRHDRTHESYANLKLASRNPSLETTSRNLAKSYQTTLLLRISSNTTLHMCCIAPHTLRTQRCLVPYLFCRTVTA